MNYLKHNNTLCIFILFISWNIHFLFFIISCNLKIVCLDKKCLCYKYGRYFRCNKAWRYLTRNMFRNIYLIESQTKVNNYKRYTQPVYSTATYQIYIFSDPIRSGPIRCDLNIDRAKNCDIKHCYRGKWCQITEYHLYE